ncbi:MAG TPA: hypothetical protein VFC90_01675 [Planctomycetota bacterium]|nr:hypothetical protein [Planctomycetota bacterium]
MTPPLVFTAETNIAEAMESDPRVVEAFRALGLRCPGRTPKREWCVAAEKETLADAALFHEMDLEPILRALNELRIPGKP